MKLFIKALCISFIFLAIGCGKNDCEEQIKKDCIVTYELNPVCACNGKTYDNASVAECSGIEDYTLGACQ